MNEQLTMKLYPNLLIDVSSECQHKDHAWVVWVGGDSPETVPENCEYSDVAWDDEEDSPASWIEFPRRWPIPDYLASSILWMQAHSIEQVPEGWEIMGFGASGEFFFRLTDHGHVTERPLASGFLYPVQLRRTEPKEEYFVPTVEWLRKYRVEHDGEDPEVMVANYEAPDKAWVKRLLVGFTTDGEFMTQNGIMWKKCRVKKETT